MLCLHDLLKQTQTDDDPDFLSHTAMLEQFRTEARKENSIFL